MSRTHRTVIARPYNRRKWLRTPRTASVQRMESRAALMLEEEGYTPSVRLKKRANPHSAAIPTAWDDKRISAMEQNPHQN